MIRIAMTGAYPVDPEVVPGGVSAVAQYLAKGLGRSPEIDLHMICCETNVPRDEVVERDGVTVHFLTNRYRYSEPMNLYFQRRKVARVVRRIRPHIMHAQGLGLPTQACLDSGLPTIVAIHGIFWKEPIDHPSFITRMGDRLRQRRARKQLKRLVNVILTSGYVSTILPADMKYREFIINNPIGEEIFSIRNEPQTPHILVIGGIRKRKDPLTSLRVMQRVLSAVPDATMDLLGPSSHTELDQQVTDFIHDHGLAGKVRLLGLVPNEVLWQEYQKSSLLLIPSLEETAPVALGEACAVGLPAVGSDAGGIPYMIRDGETGFVKRVGDAEGMAERVVAILQDGDLRRRLASRAKEMGLQEYTTEAIARKTIAAYKEILAG